MCLWRFLVVDGFGATDGRPCPFVVEPSRPWNMRWWWGGAGVYALAPPHMGIFPVTKSPQRPLKRAPELNQRARVAIWDRKKACAPLGRVHGWWGRPSGPFPLGIVFLGTLVVGGQNSSLALRGVDQYPGVGPDIHAAARTRLGSGRVQHGVPWGSRGGQNGLFMQTDVLFLLFLLLFVFCVYILV